MVLGVIGRGAKSGSLGFLTAPVWLSSSPGSPPPPPTLVHCPWWSLCRVWGSGLAWSGRKSLLASLSQADTSFLLKTGGAPRDHRSNRGLLCHDQALSVQWCKCPQSVLSTSVWIGVFLTLVLMLNRASQGFSYFLTSPHSVGCAIWPSRRCLPSLRMLLSSPAGESWVYGWLLWWMPLPQRLFFLMCVWQRVLFDIMPGILSSFVFLIFQLLLPIPWQPLEYTVSLLILWTYLGTHPSLPWFSLSQLSQPGTFTKTLVSTKREHKKNRHRECRGYTDRLTYQVLVSASQWIIQGTDATKI